MTETPESSNGETPAQSGVFGNLPDARPGTRSPRRKASTDAKAKGKSASSAKATAKSRKRPKPAPKPRASAPRASASPPPAAKAPEATAPRTPAAEGQAGGLADVAWAGIAVAAEAATIGVRLASRAIEAVRGNPERD